LEAEWFAAAAAKPANPTAMTVPIIEGSPPGVAPVPVAPVLAPPAPAAPAPTAALFIVSKSVGTEEGSASALPAAAGVVTPATVPGAPALKGAFPAAWLFGSVANAPNAAKMAQIPQIHDIHRLRINSDPCGVACMLHEQVYQKKPPDYSAGFIMARSSGVAGGNVSENASWKSPG
jgi:hypothetical protein